MEDKISSLAVLACLTALAAGANAQVVAGNFSPSPAPVGVQITFTGTDSTGQGLNLPSPCGWYRIHQGSQTGPLVPLGVACGQVIVPIAPNGVFSFDWNQRDANGMQVPPGRYWIASSVWDPGFTRLSEDWFCIEIAAPGDPALTAPGQPRVGGSVPLAIAAPMDPGALYLAGMSLSSNNPLRVFGLETCVSAPVFADFVTNPIGGLDASGNAGNLAANIPNLPFLAYQGFHVQALLLGPRGFVLTNDLSFTIQP